MTAYKLENVCKSFDMPTGSIVVLKDISLEVQEGEWLALTGRSGSGKTTLLQLMGGLDKPTSGRIHIGDTDITTASQAKIAELRHKRIGFIFQSYHLFPELNSLENAMLPDGGVPISKTVPLKQRANGWTTSKSSLSIGGITR